MQYGSAGYAMLSAVRGRPRMQKKTVYVNDQPIGEARTLG
jgi:hypothetical protein